MTERNYAREEAEAQLSSIKDMVSALELDWDRLEELRDAEPGDVAEDEKNELAELLEAAGDCQSYDDALQRIQDDPLEVCVRSDWHAPGDSADAAEFYILLCTGGPAVRIVGELNQYKEPCRAWIEYQDWGTPWTEFVGSSCDELLTYCQQF